MSLLSSSAFHVLVPESISLEHRLCSLASATSSSAGIVHDKSTISMALEKVVHNLGLEASHTQRVRLPKGDKPEVEAINVLPQSSAFRSDVPVVDQYTALWRCVDRSARLYSSTQ